MWKRLVRASLTTSSFGSPVLTVLAVCVVLLQLLIIINITYDADGVKRRVAHNSQFPKLVGENNLNSWQYRALQGQADSKSTDDLHIEQESDVYNMEACKCGLHFKVNKEKAMVYRIPQSAFANRRFLTFGIPTITRQDENYLNATIFSLLNGLDKGEIEQIVIVVLLADPDSVKRNKTASLLKANYPQQIQDGVIQIIQASDHLFTSFQITKLTYWQGEKHVAWRSKQNFDYAFLMRYAFNLSKFYMQLEDDVIVAKGYLGSIREYIHEQKDNWTCLEFSELGFIGKLYHSEDVERLSQLLLMFYQEQPVDYTYLYYNMLMTQFQKRLRMPTLFQHQGIHSSLPGKIQPLKDRFFDKMEKVYKGDNPSAELYTTMKTYLNFVPNLAYGKTEGYFWTDGAPGVGDSFIVVFDQPQTVTQVIVDTGSFSHPSDMLENAILVASLTLMKNPVRLECTNDIDLGSFNSGKINVTNIDTKVNFKVMCLQIKITKSQTAWAIIREIAVFVKKS